MLTDKIHLSVTHQQPTVLKPEIFHKNRQKIPTYSTIYGHHFSYRKTVKTVLV